MGKTTNYAVVMAQLYTQGKCEGTHPFLVQLRSEETHEPLPGVVVGEIGPKLGMNTNDNGYLGFNQVRIPRNQMLMKHSQVLKVIHDLPYAVARVRSPHCNCFVV